MISVVSDFEFVILATDETFGFEDGVSGLVWKAYFAGSPILRER
jgi:hypothetical protein